MKVELIAHTPNPEKSVACAAKLCYSACSIDEISDSLEAEKAASFVEMLMKLGHQSPLEHITFTFAIEGVSRTLLAQLTRHRIASYSVQSQRYVKSAGAEYVIPPEIEKIPEAKAEFERMMLEAKKSYDNLTEILTKHYGSDDKKTEKKAIEDARYVLPNAWSTKLICTFNARSLLNFFSHRCCNRAQWEIRNLANEMFKLVYEVAPSVFENAGPSCLRGACSEGKMTCGEAGKIKKIFRDMKNN